MGVDSELSGGKERRRGFHHRPHAHHHGDANMITGHAKKAQVSADAATVLDQASKSATKSSQAVESAIVLVETPEKCLTKRNWRR